MRRIIPDIRSRQGPPGRPVLGVLIGGLALCAIAFAAYFAWVYLSSPSTPGQEAGRGAVTGSPSSSSANPSDRTPAGNPAYPVPAEPSATGATKP